MMTPPRGGSALLLGLVALAVALGAAEGPVDETGPDGLLPLRARDHGMVVLPHGESRPGIIESVAPDGTLLFREGGPGGPAIRYQREQYRAYYHPLSAAEIVRRNGAVLLESGREEPTVDIRRTLAFGRQQGVEDEVRALARAALARFPGDIRLVADCVAILREDPEAAQAVESGLGRALDEHPRWSEGYAILAEIYQQEERSDELEALSRRWLERNPAHPEALRLAARFYEQADNRAEAREAYRKLWTFHQDPLAGIGFVRSSLEAGRPAEALEAAHALAGSEHDDGVCAALIGTAAAHAGEAEAARHLEEALAAGLQGRAAAIAAHNLGVLRYRADDASAAEQLWTQADLPASRLAVAIARRRALDPAQMPEGPLRQSARELGAALALEERDEAAARRLLGEAVGPRPTLLRHIADLIRSGGDEASLRTLARDGGTEARHWLLFAHLSARRYDEAQRVLDTLGERDGYAAVCRIFIARERGERERARMLWQGLDGLDSAPADYVMRLAAAFAAEGDELRHYDFDWPDGYVLAAGWAAQSEGSGVAVRVEGGQLVFAGTQALAAEGVVRAWTLTQRLRLRRVGTVLDLGGIGEAAAGLALADEDWQNGVAIGVQGNGRLGWRSLRQGRWAAWRDLGGQHQGRQAELSLDYDARSGRIIAVLGEQQSPLPWDGQLAGEHLAVGILGQGPAGATWRLAVEELSIQIVGEGAVAPTAPPAVRGTRR